MADGIHPRFPRPRLVCASSVMQGVRSFSPPEDEVPRRRKEDVAQTVVHTDQAFDADLFHFGED